jgi:DNA-binding CsgD family transcriptional regulator
LEWRKPLPTRKLSFKTFTSFLLTWTFLGLILSGIALFVSPPGRIAHWTDWRLIGLTKEGWIAVHVMTAIVFLVGGLFHLLKFNWKVFLHYLKKKRTGIQYRKEMIASLLLFLVVLLGTMAAFPPFSSIMNLSEEIKNSWEPASAGPPVPHMELRTLYEVSQELQLKPEESYLRLVREGLEVPNQDSSLKEIAEINQTSPRELYGLLKQASPVKDEAPPLSAIGRRSLTEIADHLGVEVSELIAKLKEQGVEAAPDDRVKDIADKLGINPHQVLEAVR